LKAAELEARHGVDRPRVCRITSLTAAIAASRCSSGPRITALNRRLIATAARRANAEIWLIVMAAPPLLQMIYGRPRLEFDCQEFTGTDGKQLIIRIKNQVTNRLLRKLGVEREAGDILAYFDIQEQGTNRFVKKDVSALLQCAPLREAGILTRSLPAFSVGLVVVHAKDDTTWIIDAKGEGNF
jgi:hypothetical protein